MINVSLTTPAFQEWLGRSAKLIIDDYAANFPNLPVPTLEANEGRRYIKVNRTTYYEGPDGKMKKNQECSHAFIDRESGDILKPASWSAPAKHGRGNLFDVTGGMAQMSAYGPAYLR